MNPLELVELENKLWDLEEKTDSLACDSMNKAGHLIKIAYGYSKLGKRKK